MATKMHFKGILFLLFILSFPLHASFFAGKSEGWHWYQDPNFESPEEKSSQKDVPDVSLLTPTEVIQSYQKVLEQKLHRALVYPTFKNIKDYQEMQQDLTRRSEMFSKKWMQVVYQNPELDHTLVAPVNQKAKHIYLDQEKEQRRLAIQSLKEDYGLFFFFSSQCDYCHQFAPIVRQFSETYGWEVIAISADGGTIPGFQNIVPDNGLLVQWKVKVLPSLFAVNPKTGDVLPISYGLTSIDEMENRVMTLLNIEDKK
jgi:conjugal transfer pilus assembly protein TraF